MARNLRRIRYNKGMSQEELAAQAGLYRTYVGHLGFFLTLCGSEIVNTVFATCGDAREIEMVTRPRGQRTGYLTPT